MSNKKNEFILTGSQFFYGAKDVKTYYRVPAAKVWDGLRYMAREFNLKVVFVYAHDGKIGQNTYVGCYSAQYDNFRTPDKQLHITFKF